MSRIEIEHLLEKAVADALGVRVEHKPRRRQVPALILKMPRLGHHAALPM